MIYIFILLVLLIISGLFSGSETAYFQLKLHNKEIPLKIRKVLENPGKLLVSVLTGNTIINVMIASIAAVLTAKAAVDYGYSETTVLLLEVIVVSAVLLLFGEILPKLLALKNSIKFAGIVYIPLKTFTFILTPIINVFYGLTSGLLKIIPLKKEKIFDTEEELKLLTELGEEEGALKSDESDMIQSIFEFNEKTVHEIMTPRVDMTMLRMNTPLDEALDVIKEKQYSKIPIYKKNVDEIVGILYAKDLLPYLMGSRPNVNLMSISRSPFFVPENKNIDDLLKDLRKKKTSVAIVVDEWGGTAGMITLEDIVEEVIGEIRDPYDKEDAEIIPLSDNNMLVTGRISIYDLIEETDMQFPEERDYDTLGGFIYTKVGDIPNEGHTLSYNGYIFTVKKLNGHRIEKVQIEKAENKN